MLPRFHFVKRITPLAVIQFVGVFNDHAFKMTAVLIATMSVTSTEASIDQSNNSAFLALMTIIFVLPFLLFAQPAGYLADRFPKRYMLILTKLFEFLIMLLGTLCFYHVKDWGMIPLIGVMFLMASQSAFFSPSYNGIVPETFDEKEISHANGNINMMTFLAVILGVSSAFFFKKIYNEELYRCGLIFSSLSLISFLTALHIYPTDFIAKKVRWSWNFLAGYIAAFKILWKNQPVFIAVVADAFFMAIGTVIQAILVVYGKFTLEMDQEVEWGILQLTPALGMGIGAYLAGRFSGKKVELGLVPIGALGLVIGLLLIALFPGYGFMFKGIMIFPSVLIYLIILGISGGFFIVPLRATQQHETDEKTRGTILANANVICFTVILIAGLAMLVFTSGVDPKADNADSMFRFIQKYCLSLNPQHVFLSLACITVLFCTTIFYLYRVFLFRCLIFILTHSLYKVKIIGQENIPDKGPVLLMSNHVSFIDAFLIMSCTSRHIYFLMHEDFYRIPLLHPFVKWAGFIEFTDTGDSQSFDATCSKVKEYLDNDQIVCIFPEGKITRNGVMDQFKMGVRKMLPEGKKVPILPVRLGMLWGSIFSYYFGKIVLRIPHEIPHPASITIGLPISPDTTPYRMRRILSELAAETEMIPRDQERPLHYLFAKQAKRHPFRKIIFDFNGKDITNFKMLTSSVILSRKIKELAEDSRYVGILLPTSIAAHISILATLMCDKVPAMLNFTASKETLEACIDNAEIKVIITSKLFVTKAKIEKLEQMVYIEDLIKTITLKDKILWTLASIVIPHQELINLLAPDSHRDVFKTAILLFSSGSTSQPKGVLLSHHNINSDVFCCIRIMGWTRNDSILGNLPLFHSFGITTCFWLPIMIGARVVNIPNPLDCKAIGEAIYEHKLTIMLVTPTFLQTYMRKCTKEQFASLRIVITGAEKLRPDIAKKFNELTGLKVIEGYGCTELSPIVSINVANSFLNLGTEVGKPGSVGVCMPGICAKIVDPSTNEELGPEEEGLLMIKGPNVMQGYLNEPEKTAETIVDGWYNTGDMATMADDGYITIVGRLSRFSKIGGEMVPHEMIENKIYDLIDVEEYCLAIAGAPDSAKGEKLVAFYTDKLPLTPEEIIEKLRQENIANLWIPKAQNFIKIDELPLLGSGKLDLKKLNEIKR